MALCGDPFNREFKIRVEGQLVFNTSNQILKAALSGNGLAYLPQDMVEQHVAAGGLKQVLTEWCASFAGYHLYYPSRGHSSAAFDLLVDALRYKR